MSCDKLVYDLSSETEGSPNVFVRKDWLNIMDNQSQNYTSNQSIIDTSQLSNSNKWMSYREAYLQIPLLLTFSGSGVGTNGVMTFGGDNYPTGLVTLGQTDTFVGHNSNGAASNAGASGVIGLKNWFGQIIHSFTVDYNGTTIIQQTPFINMWNTFKLLTSLSWDDVRTQGAHIGFYPDTSTSWSFGDNTASSPDGQGVCNNLTLPDWPSEFRPNSFTPVSSILGQSSSNVGLLMRQRYTVYDPCASVAAIASTNASPHSLNLLPLGTTQQMWQNYITGRIGTATAGERGYVQHVILATVYLKHIHSFFDRIPLLKGVYMKMTMNLNNASATISTTGMTVATATGVEAVAGKLFLTSVSVPVGGVCPFMVASAYASGVGAAATYAPGDLILSQYIPALSSGGAPICAAASSTLGYYADLSVGGKILSPLANAATGGAASSGAQSVLMYIPAYTFNPPFEQAYLSSPVKTIKYSDVYQYQVDSVSGVFNRLITNGIANIKSILVIPFLSPGVTNNHLPVAQYQSPFDSAGGGTTAPMVQINNFNVQVSGQNAIYNTERYTFEQYHNQTHGQNSVNGGLTDGLTSALINFRDWQSLYCYYYVNLERMLPVEQLVPKSVFIQGQLPPGGKLYDFYVFIEHGAQLKVDALTGARV